MRIPPTSTAFTILLGSLVALPSFGIDMSLPALTATGATFRVHPSEVGLMMSVFMLGFAVAPLAYGPISDRYGRKPVVVFGCALFAIASAGCALAPSLPVLLACRALQGAGAGASMTMALAITRDLFEGQAARTKFSYVAIATMIVPMIAPAAGAVLLAFGGWRSIHAALAGVGLLLLSVILAGFAESARLDRTGRLSPFVVARNYITALTHPVCAPYILVNGAVFGALFAYVSGSPLFLINVVGLTPGQFGLVFAATSFSIMIGAFCNGRLSARGVEPIYPLAFGLCLGAISAISLLIMTWANWMPLPLVLALLLLSNFTFGLVAPNAMQAAMQPLSRIAGAVSAATGFVQMTIGAVVSGLVTTLFDGHSARSMSSLMALCSVLALAFYVLVARPAESVIATPVTSDELS